MSTLDRLLVDRNQLREVLGITLSPAEIDRREKRQEWPRRIKAGNHRNSRVYYRYGDIVALVEKWERETAPLKENDVS